MRFRLLAFAVFLALKSLAQDIGVPKPTAIVPFELVVDHVYVQATLNDSLVLSVLVDSGAPQTIIDRALSLQLGLPTLGEVLLPGFGNQHPTAAQRTLIDRLNLSRASLSTVHANSVPLNFFNELVGHATDGVLGADLFNKFVVELDYARQQLRLYEPDRYSDKDGDCRVPLLTDTYPRIRGEFVDSDGRIIEATFVLDTGSNYLIVTNSFFSLHPRLPRDSRTVDAPSRRLLSGYARMRAGRIRELRFGACKITNPVALFSQDPNGAGAGTPDLSAYVGTSIFREFTTVFDYQHHLAIFSTNHLGARQYDMAGVHILASGSSFHEFKVDQVITGFPAERKGIVPGDIIQSANKIPASQLSIDALDKLFRKPGTLHLTIYRQGRQLKKRLRLKPVI